ncbi:MAG: DUF86 domain-containing protein [Desulfobacterales bacterium]|nr:DUF86 domain-containing protein [Desulfobacterales bacterium]MCF8078460.1 DUF86 domain-containing protein [Desulfobacterales bacterium]
MIERIEKKCQAVKDRLSRLRRLSEQTASYEEYLASADAKDIAERNLQVAVEGCLDIGKIVISQRKLAEPKDNKGIFTALAEAGLIGKESLRFLVPMAGTRNILVHGYDKVDDALVYGILKKRLGDFEKFLVAVKSAIGKPPF